MPKQILSPLLLHFPHNVYWLARCDPEEKRLEKGIRSYLFYCFFIAGTRSYPTYFKLKTNDKNTDAGYAPASFRNILVIKKYLFRLSVCFQGLILFPWHHNPFCNILAYQNWKFFLKSNDIVIIIIRNHHTERSSTESAKSLAEKR